MADGFVKNVSLGRLPYVIYAICVIYIKKSIESFTEAIGFFDLLKGEGLSAGWNMKNEQWLFQTHLFS